MSLMPKVPKAAAGSAAGAENTWGSAPAVEAVEKAKAKSGVKEKRCMVCEKKHSPFCPIMKEWLDADRAEKTNKKKAEKIQAADSKGKKRRIE